MLRGISIHIGVNESATRHNVLDRSEAHAWEMAKLACEAGFQSIHLLRGAEATCVTVQCQIAAAARSLASGDVLLVSYSGHGSQVQDVDGDEGDKDKHDETWCLSDGNLLDDRLAECWRLAPAGARIVVVTEACYGAGGMRGGEVHVWGEPGTSPTPAWEDPYGNERVVYRNGFENGQRGDLETGYRGGFETAYRGVKATHTPSSVPVCITTPPQSDDGIRASLLVLAAAEEDKQAQEGLYIPRLLKVWDEGRFRGSYCDLHRRVTNLVRAEEQQREPAILMLGSPDVEFPNQPAFCLDRPVMRG